MHLSHWLRANLRKLFARLYETPWLQKKIGRNLHQRDLGK